MQSSLKTSAALDDGVKASGLNLKLHHVIGIFSAITLTPVAFFLAYFAFLAAFGNSLTPHRVAELFNSYYSHQRNDEYSKSGREIDNFADCEALGMMSLKSDLPRGAKELFIDSDLAWSPDFMGCDALRELYRGNKQIRVVPLDRYWVGYTVFTKTLLPWISVSALKAVITSILAASFLFWNLAVVRSLCGLPKTIILMLSGALTSDFFDLETAFTHKIAWAALFISSVMVFVASRRSLAIGLLFTCIASATVTFFDLLFVTAMLPALLLLSVFSGNLYIRYRASSIDTLLTFLLICLLVVLSVFAMQLFRLASVSILSESGLSGVYTAIKYFLHEDYGAKFSSSFPVGELLDRGITVLFTAKYSYIGVGLLGLSLVVRPPKLTRAAQVFCSIAALSPLLWFLAFPSLSYIHVGIIGWETFYFVMFLAAATLPGYGLRKMYA